MKKNKVIRISNLAVFLNNFYVGQFRYFSRYYEIIGVSSYDDKHFEEFKSREEIKMIPINIERTISPLKDLISIVRIWFMLIKEKPVIVHSHLPKAGLLSMIAATFAFVKIRIHSIEGMPLMGASGLKRKILYLTEKMTCYFATRIICNSKGLRDYIVNQNICTPDKIIVFADGSSTGVDYDFYDPDNKDICNIDKISLRKDLGIDDEDVVFFFVGRIGVDKGFKELYTVIEKLPQKHKIKLLLAGVFEQKVGKLSDDLIHKIRNNPRILYVGRVNDLRPYFLISDVFIFPSYREGFPNSVLEAGAMGLPCIVTDINGCNEIIQDRFNGLIIKPRDEVSLKNAIIEITENSGLRFNLAKNIRPSITSRYNRQTLWDAMYNEYENQLKKIYE